MCIWSVRSRHIRASVPLVSCVSQPITSSTQGSPPYAGASRTVQAAALVPPPLAGSGSLYIAGTFTSYGDAPGNTTSSVARIIPRPTTRRPADVCGIPITPFPDVPPGSYFATGASCLLAEGVTTNNPYNPAGVVTRGQMAAFLWRFAGSPPVLASCGFTDEAAIAEWARPGACWLKANGITTNNPYRPAAPVTREEMATFLWRLAEKPTTETECVASPTKHPSPYLPVRVPAGSRPPASPPTTRSSLPRQ